MIRPVDGAPDEMSDEALLAACAKGDTAALGALFNRHSSSVYRFLARMSGTDNQDLDDLVQSTFIEVQLSANRFRGNASVRTWIFSIAANIVQHYIRSEKRRRGLIDAVKTLPVREDDTPDDVALKNQQLKGLARGLKALSYNLRIVFVMCDLEGVSGVETARILGIRQGTVWRRLHDARKALGKAIERRDK
ncbi:MAG: RNA polymerase sigma factor [Proteobacteria bacterium]|nr:RNA polymerase sigma factor [Pseudomonadota bacterium]